MRRCILYIRLICTIDSFVSCIILSNIYSVQNESFLGPLEALLCTVAALKIYAELYLGENKLSRKIHSHQGNAFLKECIPLNNYIQNILYIYCMFLLRGRHSSRMQSSRGMNSFQERNTFLRKNTVHPMHVSYRKVSLETLDAEEHHAGTEAVRS